jgi:hypothetical protein
MTWRWRTPSSSVSLDGRQSSGERTEREERGILIVADQFYIAYLPSLPAAY